MAIVKFISEIDCNVYIDMELVGELHVGKMLKVTLEVGSYLVEATDSSNRTIKRYELKVSPLEAQILQNITDENIDDVINKLRNNSSLRFYNQRAVFCHNGCYGYINSQYNIVIQPIYSFASDFSAGKAFVRRIFPDGEKGTVIDIDGNILLSQWLDYIGSNEHNILVRNGNMFYVISRKDYSIHNEYCNAGYDGKAELIPVSHEFGVDVFYGFIDKNGEEIIPFIYDYAWNYDDNGFAKVKRFGSTHVVDKDGTLYLNMEQAVKDGKTFTRERGFFEEPGEEVIEEVFKANKLSKDESIYKGFRGNYCDEGYWEEYPVKEGEQWGLGGFELVGDDNNVDEDGNYLSWWDVDTNKIEKYHCDRIIYYAEGYFVYRKDGICKLLNIMNPEKEYSFVADEIIPNLLWCHTYNGSYDTISINNLIFKKNKKYGIIGLDGKIVLPADYDLIVSSDALKKDTTGNIGIIWKGGKCSFVRMDNGKILEPFKYDDIIVNNSFCDESIWLMDSTYMVKENGKYGCLNFDRRIILPSMYDAIDFKLELDGNGYHYYMLLFKDGKIGTYEFCKFMQMTSNSHEIVLEFTVEPDYDECVFLKNRGAVNSLFGMSYIAARKGEKWGIIDNTPASSTYYPADETYWRDKPNLKDLEFKYNSLDELKNDADAEFSRRYKKYERPHMILQIGDHLIVSEWFNNEE